MVNWAPISHIGLNLFVFTEILSAITLRFLKSTQVSVAYGARLLFNCPTQRMIVISYSVN